MITLLFGKASKPSWRSLENPNTPLSYPDEDLLDAWGGGPALSGVRVNKTSALGYSPVWRAVTLVGRDVAKLPLLVYRRLERGKERASEHPAWPILKRRPNAEMTAFQFKYLLQYRAMLLGNGYAAIRRDGEGRLLELLPLPEDTFPVRAQGILQYVFTAGGIVFRLRSDQVLHIRGMGDEISGFSVIAYAKDSLGLGIAAARYGTTFFKNAGRPAVLLEHPAHLSEDAKRFLRDSWEKMHSGLENAHRTAILEEGMKANIVGVSNEDAQFLQTRQFEIREVANWFGVPPHKLGDTTRTAFASLEQENQSYLDEALDPWLVAWEQECWQKLLSPEEQRAESHEVEFLRNALVRADLAARGAYYNQAIQGGWLSRDEVRAIENLNPIPDGEGEAFFVPLNMSLTAKGDEEGEEGQQAEGEEAERMRTGAPNGEDFQAVKEPDPKALEVAAKDLLEQELHRAIRRLSPQLRKLAKKPSGFLAAIQELLGDGARDEISEALLPAFEILRAMGFDASGVDLASNFLESVRNAALAAAKEPQALELGLSRDLAELALHGISDLVTTYLRRLSHGA